MDIPQDPIILLSYTNTMLRDCYTNLDDFCLAKNIDKEKLCEDLGSLDYHYDDISNQFI